MMTWNTGDTEPRSMKIADGPDTSGTSTVAHFGADRSEVSKELEQVLQLCLNRLAGIDEKYRGDAENAAYVHGVYEAARRDLEKIITSWVWD